jgi:hypothetical protein
MLACDSGARSAVSSVDRSYLCRAWGNRSQFHVHSIDLTLDEASVSVAGVTFLRVLSLGLFHAQFGHTTLSTQLFPTVHAARKHAPATKQDSYLPDAITRAVCSLISNKSGHQAYQACQAFGEAMRPGSRRRSISLEVGAAAAGHMGSWQL